MARSSFEEEVNPRRDAVPRVDGGVIRSGADPDSAIQPNTGLSGFSQESCDDLLARGIFLFYHEQEKDAAVCLRSSLAQNPQNLRARYLIALAAQLHADEDTITEMREAARAIDGDHPYALACEGVYFLGLSNFARAEQLFEQALLKIPNDLHLWFGYAVLHDYAGEYERAIGDYLRVITLDPQNVCGHIGLGNAYAVLGDFDAAYAEYSHARRLAPDTMNPHFRLGKDLLFARQADAALVEFAETTAQEPNFAPGWFFLLAAQRALNQTDEQIETYQEIRIRFRGEPEVTAGLFETIGAWQDAVREYTALLDRNPNDVEMLFRRADCYRQLGNWQRMASDYRNILLIAPPRMPLPYTISSAHRGLAEALSKLQHYEKACQEYRKAIALDRTDLTSYTMLAECLMIMGKKESAAEVTAQRDRQQQISWAEYQSRFYGA